MAKYSKGAQKSVESSMKRMEKGKLESGRSGKKVTNPKQAIAIGLSEARKKGAKVPAKKAASKAAPKKAAAKKSAPKKVAAKKAAAPKQLTAPKKAVKRPATKAAAKKTAPKKATSQKATSQKAAVKKIAAPKKSAPQKSPVKKTAQRTVSKKVFADKNLNKKTTTSDANNETTTVPAYDATVGKAANLQDNDVINNTENNNTGTSNIDNEPEIKDDGLKAPEKIEDPIIATDQKAYTKATTKGDPHQKLHLSQAKGGVKPSGKKPLWNR